VFVPLHFALASPSGVLLLRNTFNASRSQEEQSNGLFSKTDENMNRFKFKPQ
jgi:hypothetical protein